MQTNTRTTRRRLAIAALPTLILGLLSTNAARADEAADDWQFRTTIYGFFPDISGSAAFPQGGSADIAIDAGDLLSNTELALMGSLEARHGRWGLFTDAIYLGVGNSIDDSTSIVAGSAPLPPGVTVDASLEIDGWVWTVAGAYRVAESGRTSTDVFAGARMLDAAIELEYEFNTDFGPFSGPNRAGRRESDRTAWDGIVGLKGRYAFGSRGQWFVPYYVDAGTGDSDLTWQAATGLGYSARWGDVFLVWRHLDYDLGDEASVQDLEFSGPTIGLSFAW